MIKRIKKQYKKLMALSAMFICATPLIANAEGTEALTINFDVQEMFTWAQTIISALMPVVYVTMGLGLGFLIINSLKRAFN